MTSGRDPGYTVSYDAASGTYSVTDDAFSASFKSSDLVSTAGFLDVYSKQEGKSKDELKLLPNIRAGASQNGAPLQLSYLTYGVWTHTNTETGDIRKNYLIFGFPTQDIPRSGLASYRTILTANMLDYSQGPHNGVETELSGSATFSANFEAATVATSVSLTRMDNHVDVGTFAGSGAIYSPDQFKGTFTSGPWLSGGGFSGGFFGPKATEMGYNFYITQLNPDPYAGASVMYVESYIVGAVVGGKQ